MMIHSHEHIYSIYLPILYMLSSGTCFLLSMPFMASMLLYFYMIHISLQPPALAPMLSSIWEVYTFHMPFFSLGVYSTGARYAWHILSIYLLGIFLWFIVQIISQLLYKVGIFSISVLFIQQKSSNLYNEFIIKRTKEKAWQTLQTSVYTISLYKYYTSK